MKDKVLITSTALMAIAVAVYFISLRTGGGFYDFCSAAKITPNRLPGAVLVWVSPPGETPPRITVAAELLDQLRRQPHRPRFVRFLLAYAHHPRNVFLAEFQNVRNPQPGFQHHSRD